MVTDPGRRIASAPTPMKRRGSDVALTWYVGKRGVHKQYAHGDVGWRRRYYTGAGIITVLQKEE